MNRDHVTVLGRLEGFKAEGILGGDMSACRAYVPVPACNITQPVPNRDPLVFRATCFIVSACV